MKTVRKVWDLLDARERRNAIKVLVVMMLSAFASAAMVASVFPFLSVLADPDMIEEVPAFAWAYAAGGFETEYRFLLALGVVSILVIVAANLVMIVKTWVVVRYSQMRVYSISRRLLCQYLGRPYEFFLGRHSGDMSTIILSETQQAVAQFLRPLANLISSSLTVLAVLTTLLIAAPVVTSVTIATFALIYGSVLVLSRRYVQRLGQRRAKANAERFRIAGEALGGVKDVKLLGQEEAYLRRFEASAIRMAESQIGVGVFSEVPRFAIQMAAFGGIIVLCLVLLDPEGIREREALGGILPVLGLLAFAGQRVLPELNILYHSATLMTAGAAAIERVHADLGQCQTVARPRDVPTPLGLRRKFVMDGVRYTYPNSETHGLGRVDLTIHAGERIGIVGVSGAGKTTLADIILGLLRPQAGTIQADDIEITDDNIRSWQKSVGYVPQNIFLIDASLSENIAFGLSLEDIDRQKVERAARIAQLHHFAMAELPEGYATMIGEHGVRLSGGQRQRIGIARALYHDADLLVLDEATSALDNVTEREVMAAIEALPGDKTVILVAHRMSTVKVCDRIILMEQGRVADIGSWRELVKRNMDFRLLAETA